MGFFFFLGGGGGGNLTFQVYYTLWGGVGVDLCLISVCRPHRTGRRTDGREQTIVGQTDGRAAGFFDLGSFGLIAFKFIHIRLSDIKGNNCK